MVQLLNDFAFANLTVVLKLFEREVLEALQLAWLVTEQLQTLFTHVQRVCVLPLHFVL